MNWGGKCHEGGGVMKKCMRQGSEFGKNVSSVWGCKEEVNEDR